MTPERLAQIAADLGPKGRFARKDPALLSVARELLAEVTPVVHGDVKPENTPADAAVRHVLNRMQTDPDFRHLLLDTESFHLLCVAEAARTDRPLEDVKRDRRCDLQPDYRWRPAQLPRLKRQVELYEDRLTEAERNRVDDILHDEDAADKAAALAQRSA